jgi:CRP-like cAMP-binding protein
MTPLDILKPIRFFQDIPDEHLQLLAGIADEKTFPPGVVIFREGQRCQHIFIVLRGPVALEIAVPGRKAVRIQTIGPGELLGWTPVLETRPMTATARTLDQCRLLALDAAQVQALCTHDPTLGMEFMRRTALALAQRLNATRLQLLDVYRHELPAAPDEGGPV